MHGYLFPAMWLPEAAMRGKTNDTAERSVVMDRSTPAQQGRSMNRASKSCGRERTLSPGRFGNKPTASQSPTEASHFRRSITRFSFWSHTFK